MPGLETATIVALSVSGGLTIASTALSYFTRQQPRSEENINELDKNITDPNEYINLLYGRARVGINRVFAETWPDNIDYLVGIGSICHGEIEDIEKVWIDNDDIIAKDNDSGNLEVVKTYDGHAYFGIKLGTDTQSVFNFVRKKCKSWKKNHCGRGIASIAMQLRYDQDLYTTGIPNITVMVKGKKVRDPRDLTDPATATQADWDALTPAWSNNPSLCALDYLMSSRYGIGSPASKVDFQSFCDIANYCDTIVNSGSYIEAPSSCKAELIKSKINLTNGTTYYYKYSFVKENTSDEYQVAFESALSTASSGMTVSTRKGRVRLTGIAASSDSTITHRNIYRSTSATGTFYYIGMIDNNTSTTFIDNMSNEDAVLGGTHTPTGSGTNPTSACTATFTNLKGNLEANKLYRYKVTFVNNVGQETEAGDASNRIKTDSEHKAIYLSKIPISEDENVTKRKIYRTTGYLATESIPDYKLVHTIENNTTRAWEDTIADISLGDVPPSATALTGSFKMYQCNGVIDTSKEVDENIEEILSSCRGKIYYSGGKYKVSIRRVITPETIKLTEDNIIGDWEWSVPGFKETCNIISAEWRNPQENWQYEPFIWPKAGESNQYLIDDNNFENIREIRLPLTTVKKQAKLIAQIVRKESRQQIRCQVTVKEEGLNFEYDSLVYITHPLPGWTDKLFWVDEVGILQNGNVRLALTEYDSTSYDLDTINKDTPDGDDTTLPDPRAIPDEVTSVTFEEESYIEKQAKHWRLKVSYISPTSRFWDYSEVYVKAGNGDYEYYTSIDEVSDGIFYIDPLKEFTSYKIKILSVSTLGTKDSLDSDNITEWSYESGNTTEPPNVSAIYASVRGDVVELNWPEVTDSDTEEIPSDFDCYEIQEKEWQVGGSYIVRTRATRQVLTNVSNGTHTYFIKAKDKATVKRNGDGSIFSIQGNESITAAEVSVTVTSDSSEEMSAPHDFGAAKSVSSLTRSGTTATATVTGHGFSTGDWVVISGANQTEYNVTTEITVTDADTFTYVVSGSPATPATGTILCNSGGTHTGTEQYNHGTHGLILRMKQNYLSGDNISFEGGVGNWILGSGWSRTGAVSTVTPKNGSYMIMCPAPSNGSYSGLTGGGLEAVAGKQYIFKAWVWCNKPNTARIAMLVDSLGSTYSAYHPGDDQWHILYVVKTVATPAGTPTVYFTTESTNPTATSFFDYCGFARFYGDYISPTYDLGSIDTRRFWLEYNSVSSSTGEAPPGIYLIDLMISDNGTDFTTYSGLETTERIVSSRYVKYKIKFVNIWVDQVLYIKKMISGDGLKAGNPSGMIGTNFYIPLGNIVIGEG